MEGLLVDRIDRHLRIAEKAWLVERSDFGSREAGPADDGEGIAYFESSFDQSRLRCGCHIKPYDRRETYCIWCNADN
jgi:hypothetical protein